MRTIYVSIASALFGALLVWSQAPAGRAGGEGRVRILQPAPTDKAVSIPLETLKQYYSDMDSQKQQTLRMLEGGRYNVNIRRIAKAEMPLIHPVTADVWVVTQGGGILTTGPKVENGMIVGGESHPIKPGDVEFIPANLYHQVSTVNEGGITWLNIRWDTNYDK